MANINSDSHTVLAHDVRDWRPQATKRTWVNAPWSRTARKLIGFSRLPIELQYLYMHSISIPEHGIVFAKNSKAGCTSVAYALRQALCDTEAHASIHEDNEVLIQGYDGWLIARRTFQSEDSFRFTTVRNPLKRMISAFLDIFVERRNPASVRHREAIAWVEGDGHASLTKRFSRFVEFVQDDIEVLGPETDRHWRLQTQNIAYDHVRYSKIGRIEDTAHWLPEVFEANGLRASAAAYGQRKFNVSASSEFPVSPADIRCVEKLFGRDYDLYEASGR